MLSGKMLMPAGSAKRAALTSAVEELEELLVQAVSQGVAVEQ